MLTLCLCAPMYLSLSLSLVRMWSGNGAMSEAWAVATSVLCSCVLSFVTVACLLALSFPQPPQPLSFYLCPCR